MSKKENFVYTDGGRRKAAYVVVINNRTVGTHVTTLSVTSNNEDTESQAILEACEYAENHPGNWVIITDSQSIIDKVNGGTNATRQPNIKGIKNIIDRVNMSMIPQSIVLKWKPRLDNDFMKQVDKLCEEK